MPTERVVVDSDLCYIDSKGNLLRTRSEFSVSKMLSFLGQDYKYDIRVKLPNGKPLKIDFQVGKRYIEVVDSEADAAKFEQIREQLPDLDIIAVGHSKYARKIIKETLNTIDHKFFINKKYLQREDDSHYYVAFEGPKGYFSLQLPKMTTYILSGEATVENLSSEIIRLLAPKMPPNVQALGIYIYEGVNKGAHIIAGVKKED